MLLPIATTYSCEMAFSAFTNIMVKYRSKLVKLRGLHESLSKILTRTDNLCKKRQVHTSH